MPKSMMLRVLLLALLFASVLYGSARAMSSGTPEYTLNAVVAPSAGYALTWSTIGGGGTLTGGSYAVVGTIGQPEAIAALSGGSYSLSGGYWSAVQSWLNFFLPLIKK